MSALKLILLALLCGTARAGEDVLKARLGRIFTQQLLPLVERQPELLSDSAALVSWMKRPDAFAFEVVDPKTLLGADHFQHRLAKVDGARGVAQVSEDGRSLLDYRGVPCEARIVYDTRAKRWLVQFNASAWRLFIPDEKELSEPILKLFFHEVLRLAWHLDVISSNDNGSSISRNLRVPAPKPTNEKLPDFLVDAGPITESTFVGDLRCGEALFAPDVEIPDPRPSIFGDLPGEKVDKRRCQVRLHFGPRGKARYEVRQSTDGLSLFSSDQVSYEYTDTLVPGAEGNRLTLNYLTQEKTIFIYSHRDALSFKEGHLFRVDSIAPSVAGKTFHGEMFCNSAGISGPGGGVRWSITLPVGAWRLRYLCDVTVTFGYDGTFEYRSEGDEENFTYAGNYRRIGHNIILHTKQRYAEEGYLWISRGRNGRELVTQVGEFLFENYQIRGEVFPPLASSYVENSTPTLLPGMKRETFSDGTIYAIQFDTPREALVTVKVRGKDGTQKEEVGFYMRGGTTVGIWVQGLHPRLYRVVGGVLIDGLASELMPAP